MCHVLGLPLQVVESVDAMADDTVRFRLFSINVRQAKSELMSQALTARHDLQRWMQEQWHTSNLAQITRYARQCCLLLQARRIACFIVPFSAVVLAMQLGRLL